MSSLNLILVEKLTHEQRPSIDTSCFFYATLQETTDEAKSPQYSESIFNPFLSGLLSAQSMHLLTLLDS